MSCDTLQTIRDEAQEIIDTIRFVFNVLVFRYGDGAGNTIEENSSVFTLIEMR